MLGPYLDEAGFKHRLITIPSNGSYIWGMGAANLCTGVSASELEFSVDHRAGANNQETIALSQMPKNAKVTNPIEDAFTVTVIDKTSESNVTIALQQADHEANAIVAEDIDPFIERSGRKPTRNEFLEQRAVESAYR